jgi:hypothetical protein
MEGEGVMERLKIRFMIAILRILLDMYSWQLRGFDVQKQEVYQYAERVEKDLYAVLEKGNVQI